MNIDAQWTRPVRIVNHLTTKRGSELSIYDIETGEKIRNIKSCLVRLEANAVLEAEVIYTNAQGVDEGITLRDLEIDVRARDASRDWEQLNPMQRAGLQAFRDHMARELASEAETFRSLYPELRLTWYFISDALLREPEQHDL